MSDVELVLALLVAVAALATLADRLNVPYPILLVLGGVALGLVPGLPAIELAPAVVFLLFVPPLVFAAAFFTSWRDAVAAARPILVLAIGLVLVSAVLVAGVAHVGLGIAWAPAFVLGAVVSNTDTTAVVAITDRLGVPRRIVTVLEGESLVNDAVALTAFRLAIAATVTGAFAPWTVGGDFALAVLGAVPIGFGVGWLTALARARLDDPRTVVIVSLLTPYAAYLPADRIGASGILAVVIAGLYVGRREARIEDAETRLQARAVWDLLIFAVNGLLFILVGIQLRSIWTALPAQRPARIIGEAALIALTVVLVRAAWVAVAMLATRRRGGAGPGAAGWREAGIVAWAGLRGGDTLAAALAVPLATDAGASFPSRALVIFLALAVIVVTLVGQGLTLPILIRWLGMAADDGDDREERLARRAAAEAAVDRLDELAREAWAPAELTSSLRQGYARHAELFRASGDVGPDRGAAGHAELHQRLRREVIGAERAAVLRLRDEGVIGDAALRRVERDLDLDEARFGL